MSRLFSTLLILVGFAAASYAQPDLRLLFNYNTSLTKTDVADIDHDGDLDFVRSLENGLVSVHKLNLGTTPNFQTVWSQGGYDDAAFVDFDSDGYKDIVISSRGQLIRFFRNNGSGSFTTAGNIPGTESTMSFTVRAMDVDNDGDDDLVTGSYENVTGKNYAEAYVWKNNNGSYSLSQTLPLGFRDRVFDYAFVDVDGDGDKDLVLSLQWAQYLSGKCIWLNDGNGNFSQGNLMPGNFSISRSYQTGDFDGDGDIDLVAVGSGSGIPFGGYLFKNDGSGNFTSVLIFPYPEHGNQQHLVPGDLDLDGDIDLVSTDYNANNSVYLNDGTGNFELFQTLPSSYARGSIVADFDQNGTPDLLTSGYQGALYSNYTVPPTNKTLQTITILGGSGTQGDIDLYTDASRDGGQTWQPAYLTGWHPWGFAEGTNSWINFDPSPFVGLNSTTDYRIRFTIPEDFENPSMVFTIKADNRAWLSINGTFISQFDGANTGAAGDQVMQQSLHAGLNEITIRLQDFGGWVGLNYRIDLSMYSAEDLSNALEKSVSSQNQAPVAAAGEDQNYSCVVGSKSVTLDGSGSTDANNDPLTYSWSLGGTVVSTDASFSTSLGGGSHTFTLTVSDGKAASSDDVTVTVALDETAPELTVPADVTVPANTAGGYSGSVGNASAVDGCGGLVTITSDAPAVYALGVTEVHYIATDAAGNSTTGTQKVTVQRAPILVDIKPGTSNNPVNVKSKGVIPVAVLTSPDFDATTLNVASLRFGPGGAAEAHGKGHIEDVDNDGDMDLMLHFDTQASGLSAGDNAADLIGTTNSGVPVGGSDYINTKLKKEGFALDENGVPTQFGLTQNYPNPFNPSTSISFAVPKTGAAHLVVVNTIGQVVATLFNGTAQENQIYSATFDAKDLASGIYFSRLTYDGKVELKKMMLLK